MYMDVDIDVKELEKRSGNGCRGGGVVLPKNHPGSGFRIHRLSHLDVDVDVNMDNIEMEVVPI